MGLEVGNDVIAVSDDQSCLLTQITQTSLLVFSMEIASMNSDEKSQRWACIAVTLLLAVFAASCSVPESANEAALTKVRESSKYGLPLHVDHRLYDDNPPALPEDYPAKSDDAQRLLKRFLDLANGPDLTREHIEKEFGIRFVPTYGNRKFFDGIAKGRYPLGDRFSFYTAYEGGNVDVVLNLTNQLDPPSQYRKWNPPKVCVLVSDLYDALGKGWRRFEPNQGTHYPVRIYYKKIVNGKSRAIEPTPPFQDDRWCIENLSISDRELMSDELKSFQSLQ